MLGHEPQQPQRAQRDGEAEAVLGPALLEDQDAVAIGEREAGAQVLDGDAIREALKSPALRLVRIPHPALPRSQKSICRSSTAR
jgi:predicted HD phosphohydrolase